MIELLFVYFMLDYNAMMLGDNQSDSCEMCKQIVVLVGALSEDKVFKAAEKKWEKDIDKLHAFYDFWRNVGNCKEE